MNIVETIIEESNVDKIKEIFEDLDLNGLQEKISEIVGTDVIMEKKLEISHRYNRDYARIKIFSEQNLKDYCGFIGLGVKSIKIQDFGVIIKKKVEYDKELFDKLSKEGKYLEHKNIMKIKEYIIHVIIDSRYELKNGGSNGIGLLSADYNPTTKTWKIELN